MQDGVVFYLRASVDDHDAGQPLEGLLDELEGQLGLLQLEMEKELLVAAGSGLPDAHYLVEFVLVGVFDSEGVVLPFSKGLHVLAEALQGFGEFDPELFAYLHALGLLDDLLSLFSFGDLGQALLLTLDGAVFR